MSKMKKKRRSLYMTSPKVLWACAAVAVLVAVALIIAIIVGNLPGSRIRKYEGFTPFDKKQLSQDMVLDNDGLSIIAVGTYSGEYVEDGTDEELENVGALILQNISDKMLQIAEIEISINGEDTALFRITNLPSEGMVLALDMNRLTCQAESTAEKSSEAVRFFDEVPMNEELFEAEGTEGRLTLKNLSEDTYDKVYVYYKTEIDDGLYLGGITYRIPFEEIEGKTQIETDAGHYSPNKSEIVEVQIIEEEEKS